MTDSAFTVCERRFGQRFSAGLPVALVRPDGERRASLLRNISVSGALLLVHTRKLAPGDRVELGIRFLTGLSSCGRLTARVVRVAALEPVAAGPWLRQLAVRFDRPLPDSEHEATLLGCGPGWPIL